MNDRDFFNKFSWTKKDLTNIECLSVEELEQIFSLAELFKALIIEDGCKLPYLRGKTIVNFFLEPSTRTRTAFEMAAYRLGADVISISASTSSLVKGETLRDTAMNIQSMSTDLMVVRHSAAGASQYLADRLKIPVVNAGDGAHAHPTQALADAFTMREHLGKDLKGKNITILGDILFSRVARSNIHSLTKLGANVTLAGPVTLVPKDFEALSPNVRVCHNLKDAVADADVVMLLRIQHERQAFINFPSIGEYTSLYGLNKLREDMLKKDAIIMHPGPINRGVEVDSILADSKSSVILEQVTNGVAVRMAVMYLCLKASKK